MAGCALGQRSPAPYPRVRLAAPTTRAETPGELKGTKTNDLNHQLHHELNRPADQLASGRSTEVAECAPEDGTWGTALPSRCPRLRIAEDALERTVVAMQEVCELVATGLSVQARGEAFGHEVISIDKKENPAVRA
jgi:hypothetical protein